MSEPGIDVPSINKERVVPNGARNQNKEYPSAGTCRASGPDSMQRDRQSVFAFSGRHILAELYGLSTAVLDDENFLLDVMGQAVQAGGASLCDITSKQFDPSGVTVLALLAESHASCHTYPEQGSMFVDVFTCGSCDPRAILTYIVGRLRPADVMTEEIARGGWQRACVEHRAFGHAYSAESPMAAKPLTLTEPLRLSEPIAQGMDRVWTVTEVVCEKQTDCQRVLIGRTAQGISLFCNDERQSTEFSQKIYHEGQFYPAALLAASLDRVLVIGSSEGVVCQLAQANGARQVVHVDIDLECVRLCANHLPYGYTSSQFDAACRGDDVITLLGEDGVHYVDRCLEESSRFDLIVMDLPDEQVYGAQQNRLYEPSFLHKLRDLLNPGGACITQAGNCAYWRNQTLKDAWKRMNAIFPTAVFYELDEHDWVWIVGLRSACTDPVQRMKTRLLTLPEPPTFIDALSIERCTTPPISVRLGI